MSKSKQPNDGKKWTEEEVQYVVKNYFKKGILHLCQHLGRRQEKIEDKIGDLRREGYFLNHISDKEAIDYLNSMQEFHSDLLVFMLHKMKQEKESIEKSIREIQAHIDIQEMMFKFPKKVLEDEH
jgi:hypothetical protein